MRPLLLPSSRISHTTIFHCHKVDDEQAPLGRIRKHQDKDEQLPTGFICKQQLYVLYCWN
jgi:hypothetical protein